MNILSKKILLISNSSKTIRRWHHAKVFPDDKWLTVKALKLMQGWWGRQMARVDEHIGEVQKPESDLQQDAPFKDKIMFELQPDMLKYRLLCTLCYARTQITRITGAGLEKAPPENDPEEIRFDVQTEQKRTTPENEILDSSQAKERMSSKN